MKYYNLLLPIVNKEFYEGFTDTNSPKWKTMDGTKISVSDMETSHIYNTLRFLKAKFGNVPPKWYRIFNNELKKRGE